MSKIVYSTRENVTVSNAPRKTFLRPIKSWVLSDLKVKFVCFYSTFSGARLKGKGTFFGHKLLVQSLSVRSSVHAVRIFQNTGGDPAEDVWPYLISEEKKIFLFFMSQLAHLFLDLNCVLLLVTNNRSLTSAWRKGDLKNYGIRILKY